MSDLAKSAALGSVWAVGLCRRAFEHFGNVTSVDWWLSGDPPKVKLTFMSKGLTFTIAFGQSPNNKEVGAACEVFVDPNFPEAKQTFDKAVEIWEEVMSRLGGQKQ